MADTATAVEGRRRFAELLQVRENAETVRAFAATGFRKASTAVTAAVAYLNSLSSVQWTKRVVAGVLSRGGAVATQFGRRGMIATAIYALFTARGQRVLGDVAWKATYWGARLADTGFRATNWALGKVPFIGGRLADWHARSIGTAMRWTSLATMKLAGTARFFRHDGGFALGARAVAGPVATVTAIARFVPGYWQIPAYLVAAVMTARSPLAKLVSGIGGHMVTGWMESKIDEAERLTARIEQESEKVRETTATMSGMVDRAMARRAAEVDEQVRQTTSTPPSADMPKPDEARTVQGVRLGGNAAHLAAEVGNELAVEKHQNDVRQAGETARNIGLSADLGPEARQVTYENIAAITAEFFSSTKDYTNIAAVENDLKGKVYPHFKQFLNSKLCSKASKGFAMTMAARFRDPQEAGAMADLYAAEEPSNELLGDITNVAEYFLAHPAAVKLQGLVAA